MRQKVALHQLLAPIVGALFRAAWGVLPQVPGLAFSLALSKR